MCVHHLQHVSCDWISKIQIKDLLLGPQTFNMGLPDAFLNGGKLMELYVSAD